MSKLNELINRLCPDGVEYKQLGELCEIKKGAQLNKDGLLKDGGFPVINGGITPSGYWNEYNFEKNLITISQGGASAGYVNYITTSFWAGAHCYVLVKQKDCMNYRFLFHIVKNYEKELMSSQVGAGIPSLSCSKLGSLKIPVPPIEVQCEIVRILDNFAELTAELAAELAVRKKQYEYYRNKLINSLWHIDNLEHRRLDDVLRYIQPTKYIVDNTDYSDEYSIPVLTAGQSFILGYTNERNNVFEATKTAPVIIFDDFTTATKWVDFEFKVKSSAMKILAPRKNINLRYIYYAIQCIKYETSEHARQWISKYSQIEIPFPSPDEQDRIVSILDCFDKLCNDITEGLPAEIKTREKQFEYYRDKLLSFKEKTV